MIPRLVRKAALVIGATAVAGTAFVATPAPAFADATIQPVAISVLPYCVQASDSPGRSAQLCINSITSTGISGFTTSAAWTASGSVRVCTSTFSCTSLPLSVNTTGVGVNLADFVPQITNTGNTTVNISTVCAGSTCTPSSVSVPTYNITLFPNGSGPAVGVCLDGICGASPLAPVVVSSTTLNQAVAGISVS